MNEINKSIGKREDVVITINRSLEQCPIEVVHQLEKKFDNALCEFGFTRGSRVIDNEKIVFVYYQFAEVQSTS